MKTLLARGDWIYVLSLLIPLCLYNVALKVVRVFNQFEVPGPLGFLDQVRSEMLFNLGYAALWIGLFAVARKGVPRWIILILFHVSAILVAALTTCAHFYYETTGSTLDYSLIVFTISTFSETQAIIASETTTLHWFLISALLFYAISGPAVMTRFIARDWHIPTRTAGKDWRTTVAVCLAALVLASLSLLPSATGAGNAFSRDAVANMLFTEVAAATRPEIDPEAAAAKMPTDTTLSPSDKTQRRNVVLIFLESTRARSTTPYNKDIKTTPFLNELADNSVTAENAYAVVPHTSKALVATTCGITPPLDSVVTESEPDAIPAQCLPDLLKQQGYRTAFFQSATEEFERRPALVDNMGYEDFYPLESMNTEGFEEANYFGYEDNVMLEPSREWLQENGNEPFLTSYLTVTPHHDYVVPQRYGTKKFARDDTLNRYLNILRYQDFFLQNLIQQYKDIGLYDDTVFIILGDHGEGFGEHGRYQHDDVIYNEGLKIPLLIHDPRRFETGRIEAPVNELDVLPTVTDLLNYKVEGGEYPGESMLWPPKNRTLKASCFHDNRCLASIKGDEKYIYHYGNLGDQFFDLSRDPRERNNLADEHQEEIKSLREDLLAWEARIDAAYEQQTSGQEEEETTSQQ